MDELERLGRNAFERACQVAEESLDRTWAALQPLIEQLFARLAALTILVRLVATLLMQFWLEIQLQPAFDELGKGIVETASGLILIGFLLIVAGGFLVVVLVIAVAVIVDWRIRRRGRVGRNVK